MFAVRDSNLTVMMLMMQVFLDVTNRHSAYGFWSFERTQYLHLQVSSNPRRTDVMFLCNTWHHSIQSTVTSQKTWILTLVLLIGFGDIWFICLTFCPQAVVVPGMLMLILVSDATDLCVVARSDNKPRSQMSHILSCFTFPHLKYCVPH